MLFDASALLNIIGEKGEDSIEFLKSGYITDLTFYEVGNAMWKSVYRELLTANDAEVILRAFNQLSTTMKVIPYNRSELPDILKISLNEYLTFYDASYIHNAAKNDLSLVTDDKKLKKAANKYLKVLESEEI
ncbi:MAG: type II toxin-antitoxin system VapC family toxin [Archaeoglobaceae archaeon]